MLAAPKPLSGPKRKTYELDMAASLGFDKDRFDTCMFEDSTIDYAQKVYTETRKAGVRETPMYRVDEKVMNIKEVVALVKNRL